MVVDARTGGGNQVGFDDDPTVGDRRLHHLLLAGPGPGGALPVPGHGRPRGRRARRRVARRRAVRRRWPSSPPARRGPTRAAAAVAVGHPRRPDLGLQGREHPERRALRRGRHPPTGRAVLPRERAAGAGRDPGHRHGLQLRLRAHGRPRGQGVPGLPRRGDLALVLAVRRPGARQAGERTGAVAAAQRTAATRSPRTAGSPSPATCPTSCTPTRETRRRSASACPGSRRPTSSTCTPTSGWRTRAATP